MSEYQPILERSNEAYVKELSALGSELTLEEVSGQLAQAENTLETIKNRIPATVRFLSAPTVPLWSFCALNGHALQAIILLSVPSLSYFWSDSEICLFAG